MKTITMVAYLFTCIINMLFIQFEHRSFYIKFFTRPHGRKSKSMRSNDLSVAKQDG